MKTIIEKKKQNRGNRHTAASFPWWQDFKPTNQQADKLIFFRPFLRQA